MTRPVTTSRLRMKARVAWRTYSNSPRSTLPRAAGSPGCSRSGRLHAGQFVRAYHPLAPLRQGRGVTIEAAEVGRGRLEPVVASAAPASAAEMRLEVPLSLRAAPHVGARCDRRCPARRSRRRPRVRSSARSVARLGGGLTGQGNDRADLPGGYPGRPPGCGASARRSSMLMSWAGTPWRPTQRLAPEPGRHGRPDLQGDPRVRQAVGSGQDDPGAETSCWGAECRG